MTAFFRTENVVVKLTVCLGNVHNGSALPGRARLGSTQTYREIRLIVTTNIQQPERPVVHVRPNRIELFGAGSGRNRRDVIR